MENIWVAILGVLGSVITLVGTLFTIRHENKKAKKEEDRRQEEKKEQIRANRPRLDIVGYKELSKYYEDEEIDLSILLCDIKGCKSSGQVMIYYDPKVIEPDNWISVEYTLKNIGCTEIQHVYFSTNSPQSTSIFDVGKRLNEKCYESYFLNSSIILDKTVKPNESIKIKVCYISELDIVLRAGATITVWLVDEKKRWWLQPLFAPDKKIYDSIETTHRYWKECTDEFEIIESIRAR